MTRSPTRPEALLLALSALLLGYGLLTVVPWATATSCAISTAVVLRQALSRRRQRPSGHPGVSDFRYNRS